MEMNWINEAIICESVSVLCENTSVICENMRKYVSKMWKYVNNMWKCVINMWKFDMVAKCCELAPDKQKKNSECTRKKWRSQIIDVKKWRSRSFDVSNQITQTKFSCLKFTVDQYPQCN